jgi:DNA-binding LacI/PurR family transcriptional regulator
VNSLLASPDVGLAGGQMDDEVTAAQEAAGAPGAAPPSPGRATLADVARRAGTSRQTVSNLLNAPHLVRPETAARVREAIAFFDYRPSRAARQLRTNRSHLIGVRIEPGDDEFGGGVLDTFLHALTEASTASDYRLVLYAAADDDGEIAAFDDLRADLDVDAFVLTDTREHDRRTQHLAARAVPFVTFGRPWPDDTEHPWVDVDSAAGIAAAVDHLVANGHRRLGYLGWDGDRVGHERLVGWQQAMARHGLVADAVASTPHDVVAARRAAGALLAVDGLTAIVCASDLVAIGAMRAAGDGGRTVGRDVAIVGFDNIPAADVIGLSSIAQPVQRAAAECMRRLAEVLHGGTRSTSVLLEPRLVVRASSSAPAGGTTDSSHLPME